MAKATELKTKVNDASVTGFLNRIENEQKRQDSFEIAALMEQITKEKPKMWGSSIVGFGFYHYRYETGREGDMPLIAFSPRKQNITLYIRGGLDRYQGLLKKLGKHSIGKSCLYIKHLQDIDVEVLKALMTESMNIKKEK